MTAESNLKALTFGPASASSCLESRPPPGESNSKGNDPPFRTRSPAKVDTEVDNPPFGTPSTAGRSDSWDLASMAMSGSAAAVAHI